jgi:hypothetical protein
MYLYHDLSLPRSSEYSSYINTAQVLAHHSLILDLFAQL